MLQDLLRTRTAIVSLIRSFVWWRSRCRRRRGLLELPMGCHLLKNFVQEFKCFYRREERVAYFFCSAQI